MDIGGDLGSLGQIQIGGGATSGNLALQIPSNVAQVIPLPFTGTITAAASDGVAATTTLTIQ